MQKQVFDEIKRFCGNAPVLQNGWVCFIYRGIHFVNVVEKSGGEMIRILIPHVAKNCACSREELDEVVNEINREVKYIKAVIRTNGRVSLSYDHRISDDESVEVIVPHMIRTLYAASIYLNGKLSSTVLGAPKMI